MKGKKIILGISGGIAAYKAALLIRLFKKAEAEVKVVGTANAFEFITRVTLESLSVNKVYDQVFGAQNDYTTEHVALTDWGDVFVVAPATANIIGKMATGIADDALSTSLMAFDKQIFMAPAMNCKMYENFAVQNNLATLRANGVHIIEPAEGYLACGYEGKGRMEEPENIFHAIASQLTSAGGVLKGKTVMVTAGPTMEAIDPVRYISNRSSGKMGYAIARELLLRGANVILISGPVHLDPPAGAHLTRVETAEEMFDASMRLFSQCDAAIMSAAVADFTPAGPEVKKIKKGEQRENISLELRPTKDILASMGEKKTHQILVGFALETDREEAFARKKLKNKNLDFIVLNSLNDAGAGFMTDTNKISILDNKGEIVRYPLKDKQEVAADIADTLEKYLNS